MIYITKNLEHLKNMHVKGDAPVRKIPQRIKDCVFDKVPSYAVSLKLSLNHRDSGLVTALIIMIQ